MDSFLNIISLSLAIAALVPVLLTSTRERFWTVTVATLSLIILVGAYQTYHGYTEQQAVKAVMEEIWELLTKNQKGLTFEQIYDNLYYPSFNNANTALDSLVEEKLVLTDKKETIDYEGNKYVVRLFYRHFDD